MLLPSCFMKNKKIPPHTNSQNKQYDLLLSQEFLGNEKKKSDDDCPLCTWSLDPGFKAVVRSELCAFLPGLSTS